MTHWMCTNCGYYLQSSALPDWCPSCEGISAFNDVTCYGRDCGGEKNIDPLVVRNTLKTLKGNPKSAADCKFTSPASKAIPLVELLMGRPKDVEEDLDQLSTWAISQIEILRGLSVGGRSTDPSCSSGRLDCCYNWSVFQSLESYYLKIIPSSFLTR